MELDIPVQEEGDDDVSDENQNLSDDDIFNDFPEAAHTGAADFFYGMKSHFEYSF